MEVGGKVFEKVRGSGSCVRLPDLQRPLISSQPCMTNMQVRDVFLVQDGAECKASKKRLRGCAASGCPSQVKGASRV